jgi:hypothetical protein
LLFPFFLLPSGCIWISLSRRYDDLRNKLACACAGVETAHDPEGDPPESDLSAMFNRIAGRPTIWRIVDILTESAVNHH